jgi:hypothetical protein
MDSKLILEAARGTLDGSVRAGLATGSPAMMVHIRVHLSMPFKNRDVQCEQPFKVVPITHKSMMKKNQLILQC